MQLPGTAYDLIRVYDKMKLRFRNWCWLAIVPVLCVMVTRQPRFVDLFALAYLLAVYVLTFVTFHADTGDPERHMVLAAALYRMAPIVVLSSVWERVLPAIRSAWSAMPGRVAR